MWLHTSEAWGAVASSTIAETSLKPTRKTRPGSPKTQRDRGDLLRSPDTSGKGRQGGQIAPQAAVRSGCSTRAHLDTAPPSPGSALGLRGQRSANAWRRLLKTSGKVFSCSLGTGQRVEVAGVQTEALAQGAEREGPSWGSRVQD